MKKQLSSLEKKISRRNGNDYINKLKDDILKSLSVVLADGKDFKNALEESQFQKIADYYNTESDIEVDKNSLSASEIGKAVVISEFIDLSASQQTAWIYWTTVGNFDFTNPQTFIDIDSIFGKNSQTGKNILTLSKRFASRFEALFAGDPLFDKRGYKVTAQDVENTTR